MNIKHPVLEYVKNHDYKGFYKFEMQNRREFNYPPYSRVLVLTLKHKDLMKLSDAANTLFMNLAKDFPGMLHGPAAPGVSKVRNEHILEILIKMPRSGEVVTRFKKAIRHHINLLNSEKRFRSVRVIPDVDPA